MTLRLRRRHQFSGGGRTVGPSRLSLFRSRSTGVAIRSPSGSRIGRRSIDHRPGQGGGRIHRRGLSDLPRGSYRCSLGGGAYPSYRRPLRGVNHGLVDHRPMIVPTRFFYGGACTGMCGYQRYRPGNNSGLIATNAPDPLFGRDCISDDILTGVTAGGFSLTVPFGHRRHV